MKDSNREFTVVMRAPSAVVFREQSGFTLSNVVTPYGSAVVHYQTRWLDRPGDIRMPGQLWIEVVGNGSDLQSALPALANAGLAGLAVISVACNAAIDDPQIELAFDSSKEATSREYFQAYVRPESNEVSSSRSAHCEGIAELANAISTSEHSERLSRAANQYRIAIDSWKIGNETLVLAHLWMALEALTKAKIRAMMKTQSFSKELQLADFLGVNIKELDPTIRKKFLLADDAECYTRAKEASDGFEHGHLTFQSIHAHASAVRDRLAKYVRVAIFDLCTLDKTIVQTLSTSPYDKPLGNYPLVKFIRAALVGSSTTLAKDGNAYPIVKWSYIVKSCTARPDGTMDIQFTETMSAELADGIELRPTSLQIWEGGSGINLSIEEAPADKKVNLTVTRSSDQQPQERKTGDGVIAIDKDKRWPQPLGAYILNVNAIRNLSLAWLNKLDTQFIYDGKTLHFSRAVSLIKKAVSRRPFLASIANECSQCWNEAVDHDKLRRDFSNGVNTPDGFVLLENQMGIKNPCFPNEAKLIEINSQAMKLATRLAELLGTVEQLSKEHDSATLSNPRRLRKFVSWVSSRVARHF